MNDDIFELLEEIESGVNGSDTDFHTTAAELLEKERARRAEK